MNRSFVVPPEFYYLSIRYLITVWILDERNSGAARTPSDAYPDQRVRSQGCGTTVEGGFHQVTRRTGAEPVTGRAGVVSEGLLAFGDARQTAILVVRVRFGLVLGVRFAGQCSVRVISIAHGAVLRIGGGGQALGNGVVDEVAGLGARVPLHVHRVNRAAIHVRGGQVVELVVVVAREQFPAGQRW